jgi:hypothetical protein
VAGTGPRVRPFLGTLLPSREVDQDLRLVDVDSREREPHARPVGFQERAYRSLRWDGGSPTRVG